MNHRRHCHLWLVLTLSLGLAACSVNYKFDDDQYRPLGDPNALKRGK